MIFEGKGWTKSTNISSITYISLADANKLLYYLSKYDSYLLLFQDFQCCLYLLFEHFKRKNEFMWSSIVVSVSRKPISSLTVYESSAGRYLANIVLLYYIFLCYKVNLINFMLEGCEKCRMIRYLIFFACTSCLRY